MTSTLPLAMDWLEVAPNLPQNATYHQSKAISVASEGVGFLRQSATVDDVAPIQLAYGRVSIPSSATPSPLGAVHVFLRSAPQPGMVLTFTGTGNQSLEVTGCSAHLGTLPSLQITALLSSFDISSASHICQASVNLDLHMPEVAQKTETQRVMFRAQVRRARSGPPADLLGWLRSPAGDRARRALPSIAAALRHNLDAARLDGRAWLSEVESTLHKATARYLADPGEDLSEVTQLESLYGHLLAIANDSSSGN